MLHVCNIMYIKHSTCINHVHHLLPSLSHLDELLHPAEMHTSYVAIIVT